MGLHHSRPTDPGYRRIRHGRGFRYADADGRPLRDPAEPARVKALVIPPAWQDVWIRTRCVDPAVCRSLTSLLRRRGGGDRLLAYWERPAWRDVSSADVNLNLKEPAGLEITAKDFRAWHATVMAAVALAVSQSVARSETARRRAVARATREVAGYLGNTPAVCRASYINPRVIELYEEGVTVAAALPRLGDEGPYGIPATQGPAETAVRHMSRTGRPPG